MRMLAVDREAPDPTAVAEAAEVIRAGGLVAFPTETVYGLGANALDPQAVSRIFAAKGRPSYNPLIVHVPDRDAARALAASWPAAADALADAFWPGPLTLVVPKRPIVPDIVTAGLDTVALRMPAHPVALAILRATDHPIAAPSANRFTRVSPTTAAHVATGLGDRIDLIVDGGPTEVGIESTVVDLTGEAPVLLRPGSIPLAALVEVAGPFATGPAIAEGSTPRPSPGMVDRHYSPAAELRIYSREQRALLEAAIDEAHASGRTVGALYLGARPAGADHPIQMPDSPDGYARTLYAALHTLDDLGCDLIVADAVPDAPEWAGVADRLTRASR